MTSVRPILISIILGALVLACSKPGPGGANNINVYMLRDSLGNLCTNCDVYIKYGTTSFPGESADLYDDQGVTDMHGKYTFMSLHKGSYLFYGTGKDPVYNDTIKGYIHFTIESNIKNERDVTIHADTVIVNNNL